MNKFIDLQKWNDNGFLIMEALLSTQQLAELREMCEAFLSGKYNTEGLRSDLSGKSSDFEKERITQIMRPSLIHPALLESSVYRLIMEVGKKIIGEDAAVDFDMIINKRPFTKAPTPWHQDAAYWPDMSDTRSCSFWIALDDADEENGCMQYIAQSHTSPLRAHTFEYEGGALQTQVSATDEITRGVISAGSAIVHHGYTLHGALGNESNRQRRAWIINMRPEAMITYLRENDYDHTGKRKTKTNE